MLDTPSRPTATYIFKQSFLESPHLKWPPQLSTTAKCKYA